MLKNRIIGILIMIFIYGYFLNSSYATNTGIIFLGSSQEVLEQGEEVEITINVKNVKTAACTSYLYFDNTKLTYIAGPENTNVIGNRIIFVWHDVTGGKEAIQGELAKFRFEAKENRTCYF